MDERVADPSASAPGPTVTSRAGARAADARRDTAAPSSRGERYEASVWAVLLALLPGFLVCALTGTPPPLEPVTEWIMQFTPVNLANVLLEALGGLASATALLGAIALCLPVGGALALLAPGGPAPHSSLLRALRSAWVLRWLLVVALSLGLTAVIAFQAAFFEEGASAVLVGVCFAPSLALVLRLRRRRLPVRREAGADEDRVGRRAFMRNALTLGVNLGGLLVLSTFASWSEAVDALTGRGETLRALFRFTAPLPRQPGFPVAGEVPEVTPVGAFYLLDKNAADPLVLPTEWSLTVDGAVARPLRMGYDELRRLPRTDEYVTLRCVNNVPATHLMSNAYWSGVALRDVLARAGVSPSAVAVRLHAADGYDEVLPLGVVTIPGAMLAYAMYGELLPRRHGGPVRTLAPGYFGFKNVKWVQRITVETAVAPGYWAERGWTASEVHSIARIDVWRPRADGLLVSGVAFAGTHGVSRVQVRVDAGAWVDMALNTPALSPVSWVLWQGTVAAFQGSHTLTARMIDASGVVQTAAESPLYPGGATGLHTVQVTV